jgi:hypothetical protein
MSTLDDARALVAYELREQEFDPAHRDWTPAEKAAVIQELIAEVERLTAPPSADEREALKGILWDYLGQVEADGEEMGAFADAILASPVWRNRTVTVTDERVERAARYWFNLGHAWNERSEQLWDGMPEEGRGAFRRQARAALEAALEVKP